MSGSSRPDLEASFRSWMRAYPRRYRLEREDEIVGVLLDCAPPEQQRATASDAVHLVWSGLRHRVEQGRVPSPRNRWSDGFAALAALVIAIEVSQVLGRSLYLALSAVTAPSPPGRETTVAWAAFGLTLASGVLVVASAILLLSRRPRGAGACIAAAPLVAAAGDLLSWAASPTAGITVLDSALPWTYITQDLITTLFAIVAGLTLVTSRDSRRGLDAWGRRNLVTATGVLILVTTGWWWITPSIISITAGSVLSSSLAYALAQTAPVLIAIAAMWPHLCRTIDHDGRRMVLAAGAVFVLGPQILAYGIVNPLGSFGAKALIVFDLVAIGVVIAAARVLMTRAPTESTPADGAPRTPLP